MQNVSIKNIKQRKIMKKSNIKVMLMKKLISSLKLNKYYVEINENTVDIERIL